MNTYDKALTGLTLCTRSGDTCGGCAYDDYNDQDEAPACLGILMRDAMEAIHTLKRERDAAVELGNDVCVEVVE